MSNACIIAATDLSDRSRLAAARAAQVAKTLGARLLLAHVAPEKQRGESVDLDSLAQDLGGEARNMTGKTDAALAELAADEGAALIVLGLHRERRVRDLIQMTTMERIVLAAPCPVLIAHQPAKSTYSKVLAPSDFWHASAAALSMAGKIAPDAQFYVIHALQMPLGAIFKPGSQDTEAVLDRAEDRKAEFLAMPGLPALAEPPEIVPGGVHQVLEFRREELQPDLVAIGAMSGRDPNVLGNYARDLMRAPPSDLLVAKPN